MKRRKNDGDVRCALAQACGAVQRYTVFWLSSHFGQANIFAHFISYEFFILHGVPEWNAEREICATTRRGSLLQSLSSAKTVHRTFLAFTSCRAHVVFVGLCPTPCKPFEKGLTENFRLLDRDLKFCVLWGAVCAPALRVSAIINIRIK